MAPSSRHFDEKHLSIRSFRDFCEGRGYPLAPLEIFFEVSNVCDLKCSMCGTFSALNPARPNSLRQTRRGFIDQETVFERFAPILRHALNVHCFGYGEPTIHPEFRRIVDYLSGYEVMVDFFTNGMHLTEDLAEFLVERGVHTITVSFSGVTKEIYEAIYLGGHFETVLAGLDHVARAKRAVNSRYPIVEVNSLGFRDHVASFDAFVEMMAGHGVDVIHLKQLQQTNAVPQIQEHISIMRPWVEGAVIERAMAAGERLGVRVSADQYLRMGAATEREYRERLSSLESTKPDRPDQRPFGQTPLSDFAAIAATLGQEKPGDAPQSIPPALGPDDGEKIVRSLLDVAPPPAGQGRFHCMEPFKTMYVTRNAQVKPCCFATPDAWQLGDLGRSPPEDVWAGAGYRTIRDAILAGSYPLRLCGPCLANRWGPEDNHAHTLIGMYLDWHHRRFGSNALAPERLRDMNAIAEATSLAIAARHRTDRPSGPPTGPEDFDSKDFDPDAFCAALPRSPYFDQTVAGVLEGNLDHLGNDAMGWIWSPLEPRAKLTVSVWLNGTLAARGIADRMRRDLVAAGKGEGGYGFHIPLPSECRSQLDAVSVTIGIDPRWLRFPPPVAAPHTTHTRNTVKNCMKNIT